MLLTACGGGGGGSTTSSGTGSPAASYTATSGVAQKGPLIKGSTVTAQELSAQLAPTGKQYSFQINSDLGTFTPNATFGSQYIGLSVSGYYFDEVQGTVSPGTITLNGISDLSSAQVLNVNLLTTLAYQRIAHLVTVSGMSVPAATPQAENEVLAALHIPNGASYGNFGTLDLSQSGNGNKILEAISSLFVQAANKAAGSSGNASGQLASLMANFQSDIADNGVIDTAATNTALANAAKGLNPATIAANLTQRYAAANASFAATDITNWIDTNGDGVVGAFRFTPAAGAASNTFTVPANVVSNLVGTTINTSGGQLLVNGTVVSSAVVQAGDTIALSLPSIVSVAPPAQSIYLLSNNTKVVEATLTPQSLPPLATTPVTGKVTDGYVANSTVTLDVNDDRICESGEPTTQADAQGNFNFPTAVVTKFPGAHMVCASGGTDLSTGLPLVGTLTAPAGSTQITPLTSLVMAKINAASPPVAGVKSVIDPTSAENSVATSLGLSGTNLLTADPVALENSNPALLQTTAAVQALLVQVASSIMAAAGGGTAVAGSANTNALFANALAGMSASLNPATPLTPSTVGSVAAATVSGATSDAQKNDGSLHGLSQTSLAALSPASMAAFVGPSISAMANDVGGASIAALTTVGANNPAANVQSNVSVANTVGSLASTILTSAAASANPNLSASLATIAGDALPTPSATGVVTVPAGAAAAVTSAIVSAGIPATSIPTTVSTGLNNANSVSNATHVVEMDTNCPSFANGVPTVSCGTVATPSAAISGTQLVQVSTSISGSLNNVVLRLSNPVGTAVLQSTGTVQISVASVHDARALVLLVPETLTQNAQTGAITETVTGLLNVFATERDGTSESAQIDQVTAASIVQMTAGGSGSAFGIDLQALKNALTGGTNPQFDADFILNPGGGSQFVVTVSVPNLAFDSFPLQGTSVSSNEVARINFK